MRADQRRVTLSVNGASYGVWETKTGGRGTSDEVKHRKGAMGPQVALGGPASAENITMTKMVEQPEWAQMRVLMQLRGRGKAVVTEQPLDEDGNAFGSPNVYTGRLLEVAPPDYDANGSDPAMVEVVISTDGTVG